VKGFGDKPHHQPSGLALYRPQCSSQKHHRNVYRSSNGRKRSRIAVVDTALADMWLGLQAAGQEAANELIRCGTVIKRAKEDIRDNH